MQRSPALHSSRQCLVYIHSPGCGLFVSRILVQDQQRTLKNYYKNSVVFYRKDASHLGLFMLWLPMRVKAWEPSSKHKLQVINIKRCWTGHWKGTSLLPTISRKYHHGFLRIFCSHLVIRSLYNIISDALNGYSLTAANLRYYATLHFKSDG